MSRNDQALGLQVEIPDDLAQPLEIAMVIKGFDSAGKVSYWTASTPDLMNVEIVGMMRWGESVALYADGENWDRLATNILPARAPIGPAAELSACQLAPSRPIIVL